MKVRIYSDLHLEFGRPTEQFREKGAEDLVVLAGDIEVGSYGIEWAVSTFPHVPVVYVLGNHEFYGQDFSSLVQECKVRARGTNVYILERDVFDFRGIRILGTTLWTDFSALGEERAEEAMEWANQAMNDFWIIREKGVHLTPQRTREEHTRSTQWLDAQIAAADRPVLVVTHHAPTLATRAPQYADQISNAAFHSNAEHLLRAPVRMWIHGHTHSNADAPVNGVRVLTNQWGYPEEEMLGFRPHGLFTLDTRL